MKLSNYLCKCIHIKYDYCKNSLQFFIILLLKFDFLPAMFCVQWSRSATKSQTAQKIIKMSIFRRNKENGTAELLIHLNINLQFVTHTPPGLLPIFSADLSVSKIKT